MSCFPIVRRVRRAHRITANPYVRAGMRFEEAMAFRDDVRVELEGLTPALQIAINALAEGHTLCDAASRGGISARTLVRHLESMEHGAAS